MLSKNTMFSKQKTKISFWLSNMFSYFLLCYLVKGVKITPIFAKITHRSKIQKMTQLRQKYPSYFPPTLTTSPLLLHLQNNSLSLPSEIEKKKSHLLLLFHSFPLAHRIENSSFLQKPLCTFLRMSFLVLFLKKLDC